MQQQKIEAISDPDLEDMIDILKNLMDSDDSDLRVWAKVQCAPGNDPHVSQ